VLSFATYFSEELQAPVQFIPLGVFAAFVLLQLSFPKRWPKHASLFAGEGCAILWLVPLFTFVASMESRYDKSIQYWALNAGVLFLARLLAARVSVRDMLEGFFWSGIVCLGLLLLFAGSSLVQAIDTLARFSDYGFHPNTLGFIFAGFFAVSVWKVRAGRWIEKICAGLVAAGCLVIVFFASSRGSLVAVGVSLMAISLLYCLRNRKLKSLAALSVLLLVLSWQIIQTSGFGTASDYTDTVLQLSAGERAMDSGMTGRLGHWRDTWSRLSNGSWSYGNGVRASDGLPFAVDNGFLVLLYDMGIVPWLLIIGRFAMLVCRFSHRYFSSGRDLDLAYLFVISVFLVNNIVERYLFGVGNPFSLMVFILLVSPWTAGLHKQATPQRITRRIALDAGPAQVPCG
jgi:hypothetical protein